MTEVLGTAVLELTTDGSAMSSGINAAKGEAEGVFGGIVKSAVKMAAAIGVAFTAIKVVDFFKDAVSGAASLQVQQRRSDSIFGTSSDVVKHFGENAAGAYGLSALQAIKMTNAMGQAAVNMGLSRQQATGMSLGLTKMSSDLASFVGAKPQDVFNALEKGTLGATRGLKQYGINISQADIVSRALGMGLVTPIKNTLGLQDAQLKMTTTSTALTDAVKKYGPTSTQAAQAQLAHNKAVEAFQKAEAGTVPKLTTSQKAMAAYSLIIDKGRIAKDNYRKHSSDLAEEEQTLSARVSNAADKFGGILLPVLVKLTGLISSGFNPAVHAIRGVFTDIGVGIQALNPLWNLLGDGIHRVWQYLTDAYNLITGNQTVLSTLVGVIAGAAAGMLAWRTATIAWTIATKLAALAEEAFNLVMDASTIGLVVVAVAALVGGLIALYKNSETARTIMNAVWADLKAVAVAALAYITTTVIPAAIAAWQRFGPTVIGILNVLENDLRNVMQAISTVISTVIGLIQAHWQQVWNLFGPLVIGIFNAIRANIQTTMNIIADIIRAVMDIIHGRWGAAWGELKNAVSDAVHGAVTIVTSVLGGLEGTAGRLASAVGSAIAKGVKTAMVDLAGFAGDMSKKLATDVGQLVSWALNACAAIGMAIVNGIRNGIESMWSGLESWVTGKVHSLVKVIKDPLSVLSPSKVMDEEVGQMIVAGLQQGIGKKWPGLNADAMTKTKSLIDQMVAATDKQTPALVAAFGRLATSAKHQFDEQIAETLASVNAGFKKAQAQIATFKSTTTEAQMQLNVAQAKAATAQLVDAVDAALIKANALPAAQAAAWSQLLTQQKKNMDSLKATLQGTTDSALLAGNTFNKGMASSAADPLASALVGAQKTFDAVKAAFDGGTATQQQFLDSANALDDARTAASSDSNATQLLDDYNSWQTALQQQTDAGSAITAQQQSDADAQTALQAQQQTESQDAWNTYYAARDANGMAFMQDQANKANAARDKEAAALNTALVATHNRIVTHLDNTKKLYDDSYTNLVGMARDGGKNIGDTLAQSMRDTLPTITSAAAALAAGISKYLKVQSPTELGPMADLDHWWDGFSDTLVMGMKPQVLTHAVSGAVNPNLHDSIEKGIANPRPATSGDQNITYVFNETPADANPTSLGHITSTMLKNVRR